MNGNARAKERLRLARKITRFLSLFPFVKGIAVSGSLSKNFSEEHSDIDFFIITEKNRLWIARTIMHLFKKISFLAGLQHWFCMNYYIDEEALVIREKNIFTAMEVVTLLPLCDDAVFERFFQANKWSRNFFPVHTVKNEAKKIKKSILKILAEKILNAVAGEKTDNFLMKVTLKRWHKKTLRQKRNLHGGLMELDGDKHYAKPAPAHFQEKIIRMHRESLEVLIEQFTLRNQALAGTSFFRREMM